MGHRIVYLAWSPAAALIETMVHLELPEDLLPDNFQLLKVNAADSVSREHIDPASLPANWAVDAVTTRARGDNWLRSGSSALLEVPSAIVPETPNWLFNPDHPHASDVHVEWSRRFPYDSRLFQKRER